MTAAHKLEPVHVVLNYFDEPIEGIADFEGTPHYFIAEFDEVADAYLHRYRLTPLAADTLTSVRASQAASKRQAGSGSSDVGSDWARLKRERDALLERDRKVSSFVVAGRFVRIHHDGIDARSFGVAWG